MALLGSVGTLGGGAAESTNPPAATPTGLSAAAVAPPTNAPATTTVSTNAPSRSESTSGRESSGRGRDRRRRDRENGGSSSKAPEASESGTSYPAFRIINERNIFNPNRSSRSSREESRPQPKFVTFALVGTMSYDKGDFAFFDGSSSDFRVTVQPGGKIGGYQVKAIGVDSVKLEAEGAVTELRIGDQMRREDDGAWTHRAGTSVAPSTASSSESSGSGSSESSSSGGADDDVLQRLLKKREQDLNHEKP